MVSKARPYERDRERRWIREAWEYAIRKELGLPVVDPPWFDLPAISQVTLTTANLMQHCRETSQPFNFVSVAQFMYPGAVRCCDDCADHQALVLANRGQSFCKDSKHRVELKRDDRRHVERFPNPCVAGLAQPRLAMNRRARSPLSW